MCNKEIKLCSDHFDPNSDMVRGIMSIGLGYEHLYEFSSLLNMPAISKCFMSKRKAKDVAIETFHDATVK